MKKKIVCISIFLLSIIVISVIMINKKSLNKDTIQEQQYKKSPYRLEEIYKIVENSSEYMKLASNKYDEENISYILTNFYDYFNKQTPFKVVIVKQDDKCNWLKDEEDNYIIEEVKYINYYEYIEYTSGYKEFFDEKLKECEINNIKKENCSINTISLAEFIVYGRDTLENKTC